MKKYIQFFLLFITFLMYEKLFSAESSFTQSEAHLSLGKIRKLIKTRYDNLRKKGDIVIQGTSTGALEYDEKPLEMYLDLIASTLAKEGEFKKTHYVFYHGQTSEWRIAQDLYHRLYETFSLKGGKLTNFEFLRFQPSEYTKTPSEFLQEQMKDDEGYDLINDNEGNLFLLLLSANLALFGNMSFPGECTWEYFINILTRKTPSQGIIEGILNTFGVTHTYIDEIMDLGNLLQVTPEQQLFQIFVPKNLVDTIAYLAVIEGIPADKNIVTWAIKNLPKKFEKSYTPFKKKLEELREIIREKGEKNRLFAKLIARIDEGDFSVQTLLHIYCNNPETIDNINYLQARLLFTKNILLNPFVGIKMFRYTRFSKKQELAYQTRLGQVIEKIIKEGQNFFPPEKETE
ncbi:MAG TPA: hypothetical protein VEK38_01575 [Candidatus Bathyarchaeia archaeon]|nr:hypothetical protein [Candidatus Bathyarchaeia archaeon]